MPAVGGQRQEDDEFKAGLGYMRLEKEEEKQEEEEEEKDNWLQRIKSSSLASKVLKDIWGLKKGKRHR